jgi:hypothetical protein
LIVRSPNTSLFLAHKRKKKIITPTICNILPYYLKQQGSPFVLAVKETESKYNHISAHFTIRGKEKGTFDLCKLIKKAKGKRQQRRRMKKTIQA